MNAESSGRIEVLRDLVKIHSLDAILVYGDRHYPGYIRWALGSPSTSSGTYILARSLDVRVLELSYRLSTWSHLRASEAQPVSDEDLYPEVLASCLRKARRVGVIGPAPAIHLCQLPECDIVDMLSICPDLTALKDDVEIERISELARATSGIVRDMASFIRPGVTEIDVARQLRSKGALVAEQLAFPPSILSGNRLRGGTAGTPTERTLAPGDAVLIDVGLSSAGLTSDITRMFFVGNSPLEWAYQALEASMSVVAETVAPGITLGELVHLTKRVLREHDLPEQTLEVADLGHGIGFMLHEYPMLVRSNNQDTMLQAGMVVTLEPEITVDGFKLRVEDMIVIGRDGSRIITR
jgi:Xaa-Pro aminopeptidase